MIDLNEKVCVVTGANRGIGKAIASKLREAKGVVVGIDMSFDNDENFLNIQADLSSSKDIERGIKALSENFDKIDVLVNCAGLTIPSKSEEYDFEDWRKTFAVNLDGAFLLTSSMLFLLKRSVSASVINITSLNASLGFPNNPAYVSSKTGLLGLTRAWSVDWGKYGIRSNCVSPGYIKTEMTGKTWEDLSLRKQRTDRTSLGRWGSPEDIANTTIFLASDMSSYITGQMINVDGGWTSKGL